MSYRLNPHESVPTITRFADNVTFPHSDADPNYAGYLAWLQAGGTPEIDNTIPEPPAPELTVDEKIEASRAVYDEKIAMLEKRNAALEATLIDKAVLTKAEVVAKADATAAELAVAVEAEVKG